MLGLSRTPSMFLSLSLSYLFLHVDSGCNESEDMSAKLSIPNIPNNFVNISYEWRGSRGPKNKWFEYTDKTVRVAETVRGKSLCG